MITKHQVVVIEKSQSTMASADHLFIDSMLKTFNNMPKPKNKGMATEESILVTVFIGYFRLTSRDK